MINIFQPALEQEELEAVGRVFESNWVGKGKLTDRFEEEFAQHLGVNRNLIRSVNSCTEGLFQSMNLLGIGPGDEVILPSVSFVGAANAIVASGAKPVFCDVDKRTLNATAQLVEEKISAQTRAVIIIHYGGVPCHLDDLCALLRQRNIALIEDSACSVASRYAGKACGAFGDIGTWSFDAMKILVTGDGGMIYCNNPELARRAELSLYLGLESSSGFSSGVDKRWWDFSVACSGRRSIMNDIASAIGLEQLKKLPRFIARRKAISEYYQTELAGQSWLTLPPGIPPHMESSYYFYWVQTRPGIRDNLARFLRDNGVYTTFRYYPLHQVRFYDSPARLPGAEEAAETTLCIPIHHSLSDEDVHEVVNRICEFGQNL